MPSICFPICGDGILIDKFEECDDNNMINGDSCSNVCKIEALAKSAES